MRVCVFAYTLQVEDFRCVACARYALLLWDKHTAEVK
jgi:hypothetical protein